LTYFSDPDVDLANIMPIAPKWKGIWTAPHYASKS